MPFDVFDLRDRVVNEYRDYFESFVRIRDERIDAFVHALFEKGEPWPDAVLQLNPAFVKGESLGELASAGVVAPETARFFGPDFRLHKHQQDALERAQSGNHYIVTTGTGSGKSWTYLVPLVDHIFKNNPQNHSVRAVIVYPMNALINSQLNALQSIRDRNWPDAPIRFERYTGQDDDDHRNRIQSDPPHILLTNYVMLEYMLVRPFERTLLETVSRDLRFLVTDEMHVYRGRQGADVAMLLRRVNQKAGARLMFVGTSATIATGSGRDERNRLIAGVASTLFGVDVKPENVVGETLEPLSQPETSNQKPETSVSHSLAAAICAKPPGPNAASVRSHPLTGWIERTFGIREEADGLVRQRPTTLREGVESLAKESALPEEQCEQALKACLEAGNLARLESGDPVFAFRLHQFLASGRTVYSTIESAGDRELTVTAQYWAPGKENRLLYPLAFCRECGQEYYMTSLDEQASTLQPRSPLLSGPDDDAAGRAGYFAPDREGLWLGEEEIPDSWFDMLKSGPRLKKTYKDRVPQQFWIRPDGNVSLHNEEGSIGGWWLPRPFLICLSCRTVYEPSMRSDFIKLATLSQTGRSTATTITTAAANLGMLEQGIDQESAKVLSFTDNRQDASLQAGHLNDFVQIALLRGALARAVKEAKSLTAADLGIRAFATLDLAPQEFMATAIDSGPGYVNAKNAMIGLLEYRAFEDLRRAWRVAQPNLEQAGLLKIEYDGLTELAYSDELWTQVLGFRDIPGARREEMLRAVLDHLRSRLVVDSPTLEEEQLRKIARGANEWLCDPWTVDANERLHRAAVAVPSEASGEPPFGLTTVSLGRRSAIARYLKQGRLWDRSSDFSSDEVELIISGLVAALHGHILRPASHKGQEYGVRIIGGALRWVEGAGQAPPPDPIRFRQSQYRREAEIETEPNEFFADLYGGRAANLKRLRGREHTAQVSAAERIVREKDFREGRLPALFCSPTMELGIDISDLYVVHMRNVPRSPSNYAQRSGRAGRGGRPALVLTFCSQGSAHDEHYFHRRTEMIAGSVLPARMDLANRELVEAHLHALWLSFVGAPLGHSISEFLDLASDDYPLESEFAAKLQLSQSQKMEILHAFRSIVGAENTPISRADWYSDEWLRGLIDNAPGHFDSAMNRWRDLYSSAWADMAQAEKTIKLKLLGKKIDKDKEARAEAREAEARREIALLLNQNEEHSESDFYPYRYLASEGFLPGYNFPPQPLRALIPVAGGDVQSISRARFLALREFGPRNVIYHEGQKNIVTWCLPTGEKLEERVTRAKICNICGYIHPDSSAQASDVCEHCGSRLEGPDYAYPQRLLNQPTVRTKRSARITSDEEERTRWGYNITTHYRFAPNRPPKRALVSRPPSGDPISDDIQPTYSEEVSEARRLLDITSAAGATVWQINNGWKRAQSTTGFTLTLGTGDWRKPDDDLVDTGDDDETSEGKVLTDVRPYVTDSRNILLVNPCLDGARQSAPLDGADTALTSHRESRVPAGSRQEATLKTLLYALEVGIRLEYQVEENEVRPELVGNGANRRILLWEAAEGGTGVWERIMRDPSSFARIARQALTACHFDRETGAPLDTPEADACSAACYECLLSYTNQRDHRLLDRFLVREFLLSLSRSVAEPVTEGRDYDDQFQWLMSRTDPASSLERHFLEYLHTNHLHLPDVAQQAVKDVYVQPDFAFLRQDLPEICVFVDGPAHDTEPQKSKDAEVRSQLEARGHSVIVIGPGDFGSQLDRYADVFGSLTA